MSTEMHAYSNAASRMQSAKQGPDLFLVISRLSVLELQQLSTADESPRILQD